MTVVTTILLFFLIIVFDVHCGPTPTNDETLLDNSLKTFKKDFNKLTENAEEFIEDFVHQVEEAGKLVGAVYQSDDEFNWHDATTAKPSYHLSMATMTPHITTTYVPYAYNKILKHPKSETSNEIRRRKRRSVDQKFVPMEPVPIPPRPQKFSRNMEKPVDFEQPEPRQVILGSEQQLNRIEAPDIICDNSKQNQQIEELKSEVAKIGNLVSLLQDQNKLLHQLQPKNSPQNIPEDPAGKQLDSGKGSFSQPYTVINVLKSNLSEVNKLLEKERNKEDLLEKELKRQNNELKFVKAMMEHLYEQIKSKNEDREEPILGSIIKVSRQNEYPFDHPLYKLANISDPTSIVTSDDVPINPSFREPAKVTKEITEAEKIYDKYLEDQEAEILNKITYAILMQLTKTDPDRFKKFNMSAIRSSQDGTDNHRVGRESLDDLRLRLKVLDALAGNKDKDDLFGKDIMKSLLVNQPEKKSDDTLEESLSLLLEAKRKQEKEERLRSILKSLNSGPQSKIEDSGVQTDLRQLQKAIDSLRPKEDSLGFRQENPQDFQSMLNQVISQNSGVSSSLNEPVASGFDKSQPLLNKYLTGQFPTVPSYYDAQLPPLYAQSYKFPNPYPYVYPTNTNYAPPIFGSYYNLPHLKNNQAYNLANALPGSPYPPSLNPNNLPSSATKPPLTDNGNYFFPYPPRGYEGFNYGSKSSSGPSLDQSYATDQTSEQYKNNVVEDLKQQIQNLENIISGLRSGGYYSQSADDRATVSALEQRIYDLKGVLSSLNRKSSAPSYQPALAPSHPPPPVPVQPASVPYQSAGPDVQPPIQSYQPKEAGNKRGRLRRQIAEEAPIQNGRNSNSQVDNSLSQITDIFKKYLVEPQYTEQPIPSRYPGPQSENRAAVLDNLQNKLDGLKIQLESQKHSGRSFLETVYPAPSIYGTNLGNTGYQLQTPVRNNDAFSAVVVKIIEKVFASLPEALKKVFGNLITDIGDSYGDYNSPLQNLLRNLGSVGYLPLVLVKILESSGEILKYLKKNQFFSQFLLPAVIFGLIGGAVLFLMFFLQQKDEPYGYIGYQGYESKYPRYQPNRYVDSGQQNYRSDVVVPEQYFRSYYDYPIRKSELKRV